MATIKASYYTIFEPELWSPYVSVYFRKKLGAAKFFRDFSSEFVSGGDRTSIPTVGDSFTATAITTTTGDISTRIIQDTAVVLEINKWYGDARIVSDFQRAQMSASYNTKAIYAQAMAERLARKLDTDLLALGSSLNPCVGDSATDVRVSTIEEALSIVDSYCIPHEELLLFMHPTTYWTELRKDSRLSNASVFGVATTPVGQIPTLFGIPLYVTTQIPSGTANSEGGHRNLLVHKDAFVWALGNIPGATEQGARVQEFKNPDGNLNTKIIADIMYGVKLLSAYYGVRIISNA
jgi:hypothetical protein